MSMNKVCLYLKNSEFLASLTAQHIWGAETGFEIRAVCDDLDRVKQLTDNDIFDLLIVESALVDSGNYREFLFLKSSERVAHIALCGENADFESARKGLMIGAEEYFVLPFDKKLFIDFFDGLNENKGTSTINLQSQTKGYSQKLFGLFVDRGDVKAYVDSLETTGDVSSAIDDTIGKLFEEYEWLDMYFNEVDYRRESFFDSTEQTSRFIYFYESFSALCPVHNDVLRELIEYVLYNPESDLRQKVLSEEMHINKSYLSTVFTAQTGIRFVDYISNVRLFRAAWLLKNTDMRINEIALRIEYKDVAYFSKLFKRKYGCSPSEYRLPDSYHFEI